MYIVQCSILYDGNVNNYLKGNNGNARDKSSRGLRELTVTKQNYTFFIIVEIDNIYSYVKINFTLQKHIFSSDES